MLDFSKAKDNKERISIMMFITCVLLFLFMAVFEIAYPGVQYDEITFYNIALGAKTDQFVSKRIFGIPVMVMPYIGALKAYIYMPVFWLFGVTPASIRIPMILLSIITLWLTYQLAKRLTNSLWVSNIIVALISTSLCFIISSKMDWGPTTIMFFLMILSLWAFFRFLDTQQLPYFYIVLGALLLGIYDKSNFSWFSLAFGVSALILYFKQFLYFIRNLRWAFIIPFIIFLIIMCGFVFLSIIPLMRLDINSSGGKSLDWERIYSILRIINNTMTGSIYTGYMLNTPVKFINFKNIVTLFSILLSLYLFGLLFYPNGRKKLSSDTKEYMKNYAFLFITSGIIFIEILLTRQATGMHHVIMLLPYTVFITTLCGYLVIKLIQSKTKKRIFSIFFCIIVGIIFTLNLRADLWFLRYISNEKNVYSTNWDPAIYELSKYIRNTEIKDIISVDWGLHNQLHAFDPNRDQKNYFDMIWYFNDYHNKTRAEKEWYFDTFFNKEEVLFVGHGNETFNFEQALNGFENFQKETFNGNFKKIHSVLNNQGVELYQVFEFSNATIEYNGFYEIESGGTWITGNASIALRNKTATRFSLTGFYPENWPENCITVTINNNESVTTEMIPGNNFNLELDFENSLDIVYISIKTEMAYIPSDEGWNEDMRKLGAYIISWSLSD